MRISGERNQTGCASSKFVARHNRSFAEAVSSGQCPTTWFRKKQTELSSSVFSCFARRKALPGSHDLTDHTSRSITRTEREPGALPGTAGLLQNRLDLIQSKRLGDHKGRRLCLCPTCDGICVSRHED